MGRLTGLRPEGCGRLPAAGCVERLCRKVVVAAPPQITKKGHGFAVGCVEGLYKRVQRVQKVQRVVDCRCAAIIIKPPTAAVVGALRKW